MLRIKNNIFKACLMASLILLNYACKQPQEYSHISTTKHWEELESTYKKELIENRDLLDSISETKEIKVMRDLFKVSRQNFKSLEPVLSFHDKQVYASLNAPNILKVEEEDATDIKELNPLSFQSLEENIFGENPDLILAQKTAHHMSNKMDALARNADFSHYQTYHVLWMVRNQILRTTTTGITGYDSPVLQNSLEDAVSAFAKAEYLINLVLSKHPNESLAKEWENAFTANNNYLKKHSFSSFDRYHYIRNHSDPMLKLWAQTIKELTIHFPLEMAVSNEAEALFSNELLNLDHFAGYLVDTLTQEKIELGKKLFNEKGFSSNGAISCATCHVDKLAFTDGLAKSKDQKRNSPSLTYVAYQNNFFYDKRSGSLEGQIINVVENETEFHTDVSKLLQVVKQNEDYLKSITTLYPDQPLNESTVRRSIADYLRSLNSWDSKWDRNLRGEESSLTSSEINGFNLFMGKAQCATCHFAPVFNGTIPPDFTETEIEHLGTPATIENTNATIDEDLGVYEVYQTESRKHFFKTPSLRNVEITSPYMHNGVYSTLEQVIDFYNRGGGYGIGITDQEYQTLPPDPLDLTKQEQTDLINFLKTLTDQRYESNVDQSIY